MKVAKGYIIIFILSLILLSGCNNEITGKITAKLEKNSIINGETTTIEINGKNTGKNPMDVTVIIIPEENSILDITYGGDWSYNNLQPNEEFTKIIQITGFTKVTEATYEITIELINTENGEILDTEIEKISIKK